MIIGKPSFFINGLAISWKVSDKITIWNFSLNLSKNSFAPGKGSS